MTAPAARAHGATAEPGSPRDVTTATPPSLRGRIAAAVAIGAACAAWVLVDARAGGVGDVDLIWRAARALLGGADPYAAIGPGRPLGGDWPLPYPLPTVLLFLPLAALPKVGARVAFMGLSAALLAFGLTRERYDRLILFLSGAFVFALLCKQWSPLLTASCLLPWLAVAWVAKPTLGAAVATAAPRRAWVVGLGAGAALAFVSFALVPGWVGEFLAAARQLHHVTAPVAILPAGPLVLLGLLRWRRPEARLLVALACVPQTTLLYEALPLALVARSRVESMLFALLSWAAWFASLPAYHAAVHAGAAPRAAWTAWAVASGRWMVLLCYLPCVVMVLRRPNEGALAPWLERALLRAGAAARRAPGGRSVAAD